MRILGLIGGLIATFLWTIQSIPIGLISGVSVLLLWRSLFTAYQNEADGFHAAAEAPAKISFWLSALQLVSLTVGLMMFLRPSLAPGRCNPNYSGRCVPIASDVDCIGQNGDGPKFVRGPVTVVGTDIYGLDENRNGIGCE